MDLPKFHETFIPNLKVLSDGKTIHYTDLSKRVRDEFYADLPEELTKLRTKNGEQLILNRIRWAKSYLKKAGYVESPERGMVKITQKGLDALKRGTLSLKDVKNDPVFIEYERERQAGKEAEEGVIDEDATPQDLIDAGFKQIEKQIKEDLLDKLKTVDPYYFEKIILLLLERMGYGDLIETAKSGDGGIDGIVNQDKLGLEKIYIQAKRYNENKVREKDIRNFIGAMSGDTSKGVFVTTSTFDEGAVVKAKEAHHQIILIDGNKLVDLMYEYSVGLQVESTYEVKELDEDFFEAA
jgi:restriction system protein